jgi:coenzyme F420-reducing hydrogenase delta subunit
MTVWLPIIRKICGNLIRLKYLLKAANKSENGSLIASFDLGDCVTATFT